MRSAVDQDALSRDIARMRAAEVGTESANLHRIAEAFGRQLRPARGKRLFGTDALLLRPESEIADQPVGGEWPRQDIVDRDVAADMLTHQGADEPAQASARRGAQCPARQLDGERRSR